MMAENFISEPALKDLYFGPMKPFLDCFEGLLLDQGYTKQSIQEKIRIVTDFRKWLDQRCLELKELSDRSIGEFIKCEERKGTIRRGQFATLRFLLQHLGIPLDSQKEDCGVHDIEKEFAQYLTQERGLSPVTVERYIPMVRHFLDNRLTEWQFR